MRNLKDLKIQKLENWKKETLIYEKIESEASNKLKNVHWNNWAIRPKISNGRGEKIVNLETLDISNFRTIKELRVLNWAKQLNKSCKKYQIRKIAKMLNYLF